MITMILATCENGAIGKGDGLPWSFLPDDMKRFKELTVDKTVLMGRKTWETIPEKFRPLPKRTNLVASQDPAFHPDGVTVVRDVRELLAEYQEDDRELMVMGGAQLYKLAHPYARYMHITYIYGRFKGDTHYTPCIVGWEFLKQKNHPMDERHEHAFSFFTLERVHDKQGRRIR